MKILKFQRSKLVIYMREYHLKSLCIEDKTLMGLLIIIRNTHLNDSIQIRPYGYPEYPLVSLFQYNLAS